MKRVLFIQNGEYEGPGLFARVLEEHGVAVEIVHPWCGEKVPASPAGWDAVAVGGGGMSAYDTAGHPFLSDIVVLLREARAQKVPVLGLCLGAQLMAEAFGGKAFRNSAKEIGFFGVRFTPEAEGDPLWRGLTSPLHPVHWHGDTFSLPPGAVLLASSDLTPHQLFRLDGIHYGVQFHPEIDRPLLAEMVTTDDGGGLPEHGIDPQEFLREAGAALVETEKTAREFFTRWSSMA